MRAFVAALALLVLLGGCSRRYQVRADELNEARRLYARGHTDAAVRATNEHGRPTWVKLRALHWDEPVAGDAVVAQATDVGKGLRTAGWALVGTAATATALVYVNTLTDESKQLDRLAAVVLAIPVVTVGAGLVATGYAVGGPEVGQPPGAQALPPARR